MPSCRNNKEVLLHTSCSHLSARHWSCWKTVRLCVRMIDTLERCKFTKRACVHQPNVQQPQPWPRLALGPSSAACATGQHAHLLSHGCCRPPHPPPPKLVLRCTTACKRVQLATRLLGHVCPFSQPHRFCRSPSTHTYYPFGCSQARPCWPEQRVVCVCVCFFLSTQAR